MSHHILSWDLGPQSDSSDCHLASWESGEDDSVGLGFLSHICKKWLCEDVNRAGGTLTPEPQFLHT